MSKALLKIVGAQCFPAKMLSEVILGLPPLQLIAEQVTVKFILKCLGKQDNLAARILQIETTPQHSFYQQIMAVKEFLKWKSDIQVSTSEKRPGIPAVAMTSLNMQSRIGSIRTIQLSSLKETDFIYGKEEIQQNLCYKWDKLVRQDLKEILKTDPFNIEEIHSEEYLSSFIDTNLVNDYDKG